MLISGSVNGVGCRTCGPVVSEGGREVGLISHGPTPRPRVFSINRPLEAGLRQRTASSMDVAESASAPAAAQAHETNLVVGMSPVERRQLKNQPRPELGSQTCRNRQDRHSPSVLRASHFYNHIRRSEEEEEDGTEHTTISDEQFTFRSIKWYVRLLFMDEIRLILPLLFCGGVYVFFREVNQVET